ncbi:hypothetical protein GGD46_001280 [Rhizobium lusitanum]|uniref:Uncharacterized protein n=1 Tax=Rhizobium lusitanum TaxID=293958 RepID=A0A7X0MB12_9HYPH|nr:hypothetical protein [Rhizobium lusitanum]
MICSKALPLADATVDSGRNADFLSLNFTLEMHWFLDNHSKSNGNPGMNFSTRFVSSTSDSQGKFLVSSAAA